MNSPTPPRKLKDRATRLIRRVHLYSGLLLYPWVLFFGLSGLLFNHPTAGEDVHGRRVTQEVLGIEPLDPNTVASAVLSAMNSDALEYELLSDFEPYYDGVALFPAPGDPKNHMLLLDVQSGQGIWVTRPPNPPHHEAPFASTLDGPYRTASLTPALRDSMRASGIEGVDTIRAHPLIAPELRFRARDKDGQLWNVTYHLGSGRIDGRPSDADTHIGFNDLLSRLHRTHHFPIRFGPRFGWALFADLTALTLLLWALSGLFMWWQMPRLRRTGLAAVGVSMLLAIAIFWSTAAHLQFGNVRPRGGPGDDDGTAETGGA